MPSKLSYLDLLSLDSAGLQIKLNSGLLTSVELVQECLAQIDKHDQRGAKLNAMISVVPSRLLMERSAHLDLTGYFPRLDNLTLLKLEEMSAIILGKTNLNVSKTHALVQSSLNVWRQEFCNFDFDFDPSPICTSLIDHRGDVNSNGWSAVGGQTQSAYIALRENETGVGQSVLDPCGSSTGSAVGISAGYAPLALGTELIGSIVMPASRAGLYALKPTLNSVDMDGVFQSSLELDVVGGLARSAADLAILSHACFKAEKRNLLPGGGYLKFLTGDSDSPRIGFLDSAKWLLHPDIVNLDKGTLDQMNEIYLAAIQRIKEHSSADSVVHPIDIPHATELWYEGQNPIDIIMYQNQLLKASRDPPTEEIYETFKKRMRLISTENGIDKLFDEQNLNILAFPMDSPITSGTYTGYPIATMPLGVIPEDGRPYGLGIMAQAGREDLMFQFMSAFEAHFPPRVVPSRVRDDDSI
ncbi:hypothetical protein N7493_011113 [Penicillium malachiteum]|uniref:Amidase domain-containing protein n=1 Tax=Penicillium malachiteum TaxID=1324776 RepID=A0AAD6HBI8_9EURO|nr:hypothetical protein N7493_011113 [Penicillium malachiteum]